MRLASHLFSCKSAPESFFRHFAPASFFARPSHYARSGNPDSAVDDGRAAPIHARGKATPTQLYATEFTFVRIHLRLHFFISFRNTYFLIIK
jgi:hypothetical protein